MSYLANFQQKYNEIEVYDVGSHQGRWSVGITLGAHSSSFMIKIFTFDPVYEPKELQHLLQSEGLFESSKIKHMHTPVAISQNLAFMYFDTHENRKSENPIHKVVPCKRIEEIIEFNQEPATGKTIRVLKVDIEGMEFELLKDPTDLSVWQIIQFESSKYTSEFSSVRELMDLFANDFTLFVVSQSGLVMMTNSLIDLIQTSGITNLVAISNDLIDIKFLPI